MATRLHPEAWECLRHRVANRAAPGDACVRGTPGDAAQLEIACQRGGESAREVLGGWVGWRRHKGYDPDVGRETQLVCPIGSGLRWVSLGFLVVTIGKVFLYDLGEPRDLHRVISLVGLAISLLLVSLVYQRFVLRSGGGKVE